MNGFHIIIIAVIKKDRDGMIDAQEETRKPLKELSKLSSGLWVKKELLTH